MSERSHSEPSPVDGTPPPAGAEGRRWGALATGLVGGLAAAALLVLALHMIGWLNRADPALQERLAAAEAALAGVDERIAAARAVADSALSGIDERISAAAGSVERRIAALEERPLPEVPPPVNLEPLQAALESGVAEAKASSARLAERLGGLAERDEVAALGERLAAVEARLSEIGSSIDSRIGTIEGEIGGLRGALGDVVREDRVAAVEGEVASLRASLAEVARSGARVASGALALVELDRALATGAPLETPLQPLREIAADDPVVTGVVAELEPLAAAEVPTIEELREGLARIEPASPGGAEPGPSGTGWVDRTLSNITGLVEVRELGTERGAVDAAEAALDGGDLAGAVAAIEPVAAEGSDAAAWLAAARRRLAGEAALERLRAHLAALVDPDR